MSVGPWDPNSGKTLKNSRPVGVKPADPTLGRQASGAIKPMPKPPAVP